MSLPIIILYFGHFTKGTPVLRFVAITGSPSSLPNRISIELLRILFSIPILMKIP
jgi:hypothetical protein